MNAYPKFFTDCWFLLLEQLAEIRTTWYWHLIFALVLPIAMLFGFARMGTDQPSREHLLIVVTGAAIFSVVNDGLYVMAVRIGEMRKSGLMVYYASLPISKTALLIALVVSRLLITMPGMLITLLIGSIMYDLNLVITPSVILLLLLLGLTFSPLGMALAVWLDNLEFLMVVVNVFLLILITATPVFIMPSALPAPLQLASYFLPPTYAAAALRSTLSGIWDTQLAINIGILILLMVGSFLWLERRGNWQV